MEKQLPDSKMRIRIRGLVGGAIGGGFNVLLWVLVVSFYPFLVRYLGGWGRFIVDALTWIFGLIFVGCILLGLIQFITGKPIFINKSFKDILKEISEGK